MPAMKRNSAARVKAKDSKRRDAVVNLRMPKLVRDLIDSAAAAVGKTRTDFIVESSQQHAIDTLIERRLFTMTAQQYDAFLAILDEPPAPNEKLRRLFASRPPWAA